MKPNYLEYAKFDFLCINGTISSTKNKNKQKEIGKYPSYLKRTCKITSPGFKQIRLCKHSISIIYTIQQMIQALSKPRIQRLKPLQVIPEYDWEATFLVFIVFYLPLVEHSLTFLFFYFFFFFAKHLFFPHRFFLFAIYIYIYIYIYLGIHTHTHTHIYIYIYIYISHGTVCDSGFHAFNSSRVVCDTR